MTIIFVCTGNTCRSPLAESLAQRMADERRITDVTFTSAGIGALEGAPASDAAILVGIERGVDLSRHRARSLSSVLHHTAGDTLILTLSKSHLPAVHGMAPNTPVYLLDDYASRGEHRRSVSDPYGGELDDYRTAADHIEAMLQGALDRIATERTSRP